jgi:plastocyanin
MTSRWLICFRIAIALSSCAWLNVGAPLLRGVSVTGKVELAGSRDPSVAKHANYSGVVVWLEPLNAAAPLQPKRAEMIQKQKMFLPHVLAIPVGSTVNFPNYDPIFHNAFSNYSGQLFDVGLYPPKTNRAVQFRREGIVRVFCNIHPSMSAVIVVLTTPYFAVSSRDGSFTIPNVPPGNYQLHVFHERATQETLDALSRKVTVDVNGTRLGPLVISEAGYLLTPHKNKFDRDYPPVIDDFSTYPGAKK